MNHALILNAIVCAIVMLALAVTKDPLVLMCLFFLQDMPYGLLQKAERHEDEEEEGKPMGFVH